jgi:3-hydroxyacyl-[acyl-carrier-protein] dehydratase
VPTKEPLVPFADYDVNNVIADIDEIRRYNPQRFEMEHLTAIVHMDTEQQVVVGYKDTSPDDFWTSGHMPDLPLMPGVLMCEAAAQLASFYVQRHDLLGAEMVGFGGLDEVRFRDPVRPGDRLVIQCQQKRLRRGALVICRFQCYVEQTLVVDGNLRGIPLPADALRQQ